MTTPHLTSKDLYLLEALRSRCLEPGSAYGRLLAEKIDTARMVLGEDIDPDRVTLNTRLRYRIDGGRPARCLLVQSDLHGVVGLALPITTMRGLALLGLGVGDTLAITLSNGLSERVEVVSVEHQPEAARRARDLKAIQASARPALRLVHSAEPLSSPTAWRRRPDDPGPSAA
jgi:regulator of nucleoside diphosphate kinase